MIHKVVKWFLKLPWLCWLLKLAISANFQGGGIKRENLSDSLDGSKDVLVLCTHEVKATTFKKLFYFNNVASNSMHEGRNFESAPQTIREKNKSSCVEIVLAISQP